MESSQKKILTWWGSHILTSILISHMMVTKTPQSVHRKYFWTILVTFIFDVKLDINICKPYYVNLLFFVNLLHSPEIWLFWHLSTWHLFDNLTSFWHFDIFLTSCWHFDIFFNLNHLSPSQGYFWHLTSFWQLDIFLNHCNLSQVRGQEGSQEIHVTCTHFMYVLNNA